METIFVYLLAFVVQFPFILFLGSPWLLAAAIVWFVMRRSESVRGRFVVVAGLASVGIAPVVGAHASMMPAYLLFITGPIGAASATVSIIGTWAIIVAARYSFAWLVRRPNHQVIEKGPLHH